MLNGKRFLGVFTGHAGRYSMRARSGARRGGHFLTIGSVTALLSAAAVTADVDAGETIYVDASAPAGGDGESWNSAFRFLTDALAEAGDPGTANELRIAQGVYLPDQSESNPNGTGIRSARFQMSNSVTLRGGYAGLQGSDPYERNIEVYETILAGDLN